MANGGESKMSQTSRPMVGGEGPNSYAHNSSYQKGGADAAKELMIAGIKNKLNFKNPCLDPLTTFRIADFGCSTGPNTFIVVKNIIEAVNHEYQIQLHNPNSPLEFQVFFNDLTDNDFNTLFKTLPSYQKYFAAGVPGSFYDRLFPKSSIHFVHASYALHWLSKVPKELVESPSLNEKNICCSGLDKQVSEVYLNQFKNDLNTFLNARAEEIVGGGLMVILLTGHPNEILMYQTIAGVLFQCLGNTLEHMALLGMIGEDKVKSFNLPLYYSTPKELEEIIMGNGHFTVEGLNILDRPIPIHNSKIDVKFLVSLTRAIFEGLLKDHFAIGENIIEKIFRNFAKNIEDNLSEFDDRHLPADLFVLLKRNINL